MTMQIAIRAKDGFVIASDTKVRTIGNECLWTTFTTPPSSSASYVKHESKVKINIRHKIAICTAGYSAPNTDAAKHLDDKLNEMESLPSDLCVFLESWAKSYSQQHADTYPSLLIVNPEISCPHIFTMRVDKAKCVSDLRSALHPDPTNPVTFWLQYFKCDDRPSIDACIKIAAAAILMGSLTSPISIGGLEIWKYTNDWQRITDCDIDILQNKFYSVKESIDSLIL